MSGFAPLIDSDTKRSSQWLATAGAAHVVSANMVNKFRDAFEVYAPNTPDGNWLETKASGDLAFVDGNAVAASYLVVSKDPWGAGTETILDSNLTFTLPVEVAVGLSMSQRTLGQEFSMEVVDVFGALPDVADTAIAAISQATTTLTVDTVTDHGLSVGKSIGIYGCSNPIANYPALVVASVPTPRQFTCTAGPGGTIPSQTITNPAGAKGFVYFRQRMGRARNGLSQIFENTTVTNASLYIRSEAGDALPSGTVAGSHAVTVGTTAPVQLVNSAYQYAFAPTTEYRLFVQADRVQWADSAVDAVAQTTSRLLRTQICPDPSATYKLRFRATNYKGFTVPVAQIVTAVKTGTTTATITTDRPHGLTTTDVVVVYGIRDQAAASFPNLATATAVASVIDATNFTIVIGTASTVTSYGGYVARVQGGNLMSSLGAVAQVAQSATLSTLTDGTRQLVLVGSAAWAAPATTIGDLVELVGVRDNTTGATLNLDGPWKIANVATTNLTLVLPFAGQRALPADFASTNCGGGVIRRTDLRLSFVRVFDFERQRVEMLARPTGDISAAAPVAVQNVPAVTVNSGTITTVTTVTTVSTVSAITAANLAIPGIIADVASAALTTTTTTAAITPTFGTSYEVNIPVTAVTGTTPTLDVGIEESDDTGTNWCRVYDFPRITASFPRSITRLQSSLPVNSLRQLFDRSIVLTTLNSTTAVLNTHDSGNQVKMVVNVGAITTTAPQLQLEGTEDGGASWVAIGSPVTAVASSSVSLNVSGANWQQIRARVSTAGVGVTAGYVMLKAHD